MSVKELFVTLFIHNHIDKESKYIPGKKYNQQEYTLPCPVSEEAGMQELSLSVHSFKLGQVDSLSWLRFI
jgi:hypothetical protein